MNTFDINNSSAEKHKNMMNKVNRSKKFFLQAKNGDFIRLTNEISD